MGMGKTPSSIHIDGEGVWYHEGHEITRGEIIEYFFQHLRLDRNGNYIIEAGNNRCLLDVADTPFVVSRVARSRSDEAGEEEILLKLKNLSSMEVLDPDTLHVGNENILYCRVRRGEFPARFSRPAYYEMAQWVCEAPESGEFFIELNGKRYVIDAGGPGL